MTIGYSAVIHATSGATTLTALISPKYCFVVYVNTYMYQQALT